MIYMEEDSMMTKWQSYDKNSHKDKIDEKNNNKDHNKQTLYSMGHEKSNNLGGIQWTISVCDRLIYYIDSLPFNMEQGWHDDNDFVW